MSKEPKVIGVGSKENIVNEEGHTMYPKIVYSHNHGSKRIVENSIEEAEAVAEFAALYTPSVEEVKTEAKTAPADGQQAPGWGK